MKVNDDRLRFIHEFSSLSDGELVAVYFNSLDVHDPLSISAVVACTYLMQQRFIDSVVYDPATCSLNDEKEGGRDGDCNDDGCSYGCW